jgi:acetolactate synthase-1/2/3 large subunit
VRRLVAKLGCPVLPTYKAKGVVPDANPQVVCLFTGGLQEAECIAQADLLVLVGLDPVEMILQAWPYAKPAVAIGAAHHPVHYVIPEASVVGPLDALLSALEEGLRHQHSDWKPSDMALLRRNVRERLAYHPVTRGVAPDRVAQLAAAACAKRGMAACMSVDAGAHMFSATAFFPSAEPGDTLISNGLATMAFALPAAIAASLDDPTQPVFCFTGDGGLMMCLGELSTAVQTGARIVVIVFNDSALSLIDVKQQSRHLPTRGVRWQQHDFAATMQALGGLGLQASNETEFVSALESALDAQLPCLIDVLVDPSGYPQQLKAMRG